VLANLQQLPRTVHLLPQYSHEVSAPRLGFARFRNDESAIEIQGLEEQEETTGGGGLVELDPRNLMVQVQISTL
jgi:hypothetical protein